MDNRSLISKISKAANEISRSSTRGSANYIVCSAEAANALEEAFDAAAFKRKMRKKKLERLFK